MDRRLELHKKLLAIKGIKNAYFNPDSNVSMVYPCVRYNRSGEQVKYASNGRFIRRDRYILTAIDWDPESSIFRALEAFPYYSFNRFYTADGLSHFVCSIYY